MQMCAMCRSILSMHTIPCIITQVMPGSKCRSRCGQSDDVRYVLITMWTVCTCAMCRGTPSMHTIS